MDIFTEIAESRIKERQFVLAIIVENSGHTPRDVGAKMLVYSDGSIRGTIGGGNFEKIVIEDCLNLIENNTKNLLKTYRFEGSGPDSTGMICGGEAQVFMELIGKPDMLLIFGGGHICNALVKIAEGLNFKIKVIDSRQHILEGYRFPVETILTDNSSNDNFPQINKNSYIVIVTHSHKYDKDVLVKVIRSDCAYIGMIGSHNKIAKTYSSLEKEGIEKALLEKVHAPIGIDIDAEGPSEIAISIAAELIAVQRRHLKI